VERAVIEVVSKSNTTQSWKSRESMGVTVSFPYGSYGNNLADYDFCRALICDVITILVLRETLKAR
jgi:hypothetical protein